MLAGLESTVVASGSIDTNVAAIDTVNLITESASH